MNKRIFSFAAIGTLVCLFAMSANVFAAKGGTKGPPTNGETAGNNLSFPGALSESTDAGSIDAYFTMPAEPALGVHYSYGCDPPEMDGIYSYPNTSCVNNLSAPEQYYTAEECIQNGFPCQGFTVEEVSRIYWQKVDVNNWSADVDGISPDAADVAYLDWGDALEAVSWNERSVIRVEVQPYNSLIPPFDDNGVMVTFDPSMKTCEEAADAASLDPADACRVGFQMWHVSGQGINEHWGVRATEAGLSYNYDSPFRIINTSTARLNLAKMEKGSAQCPSPGGGDEEGEIVPLAVNSAPGDFEWNGTEWIGVGGTGTENPCTWYDQPYTVELSVGGKYVYGYNWRMKDVSLACDEGWLKTGWWRLTFYTGGAILFDNADAPVTAPPAVPAEPRDLNDFVYNTALAPQAEPVESDVLYTPVIDVDNNLTYLDICIVAKSQGGGGGGGGGNKPTAAGGGPGGGTTTNPPGSSGGGGGSGPRR